MRNAFSNSIYAILISSFENNTINQGAAVLKLLEKRRILVTE